MPVYATRKQIFAFAQALKKPNSAMGRAFDRLFSQASRNCRTNCVRAGCILDEEVVDSVQAAVKVGRDIMGRINNVVSQTERRIYKRSLSKPESLVRNAFVTSSMNLLNPNGNGGRYDAHVNTEKFRAALTVLKETYPEHVLFTQWGSDFERALQNLCIALPGDPEPLEPARPILLAQM